MFSDRLSRILSAYVDGELTAQQRKAVLRVLRRSDEARTLLRQLQQDADLLRQLPRQTLGPTFADQVLQKVTAPVVRPAGYRAPTAGSPVPIPWSLAAAAAALIAVGFGSYFLLSTMQGARDVPVADQGAGTPVQPLPEKLPEEGLAKTNPSGGDAVSTVPVVGVTPEKKTEPAPSPEKVAKNDGLKPVLPAKDNNPLTTPRPSEAEGFDSPEFKVALVLKIRELDEEDPLRQLRDKVRQDSAQRLDLSCRQTGVALSRLEMAFKAQGIRLAYDEEAKRELNIGLSPQTNYALYTENIKAEEVLAVLRQLNREDREAEAVRRGSGQFDGLVVNGMTPRDHKRLCEFLRIRAEQLEAPRPKGPLSLNPRKPLHLATQDEVVRSLQGKGGAIPPRPQPGHTAPKAGERLAVVVTCNRASVKPTSPEVQRFLESRQERRKDTLQMLLVLRSKTP